MLWKRGSGSLSEASEGKRRESPAPQQSPGLVWHRERTSWGGARRKDEPENRPQTHHGYLTIQTNAAHIDASDVYSIKAHFGLVSVL